MIYDTLKSGVWACGCIECFDVVYAHAGDYCHECEAAECGDSGSCQREDVGEQ